MGGYAWVTLATNDSYSLGALVLAHSLKQVGTKQQLTVLITPGVTNPMRTKLNEVFDVVKEVNILDSKDETNLKLLKRPELGVTFTKLHCWRLTQFDKCVFLDADTLVLENCDELFDREEFSAAPDIGWPDCFNSGVFVYRPSNETFDKLIQFAIEKGSFDGGDQGLLNLYFSDWAHKDISKHLPFIYNMSSTATYSYLPAFKQFGGNVKIIHFIGATKPWLQYFDTESKRVHPSDDVKHLTVILQRWWDIFCSMIHPGLCPDMAGIAGAFAKLTLGVPRTPEQAALDDHLRRQGWEVGNIDYLGRDSFDNIWSKICQTLSSSSEPASAPKEPTPPVDAVETPKESSAQQETETPTELTGTKTLETQVPAMEVPAPSIPTEILPEKTSEVAPLPVAKEPIPASKIPEAPVSQSPEEVKGTPPIEPAPALAVVASETVLVKPTQELLSDGNKVSPPLSTDEIKSAVGKATPDIPSSIATADSGKILLSEQKPAPTSESVPAKVLTEKLIQPVSEPACSVAQKEIPVCTPPVDQAPVNPVEEKEQPTTPDPTKEPSVSIAPAKEPCASPAPAKELSASPASAKEPSASPAPAKEPCASPAPVKEPSASPAPAKEQSEKPGPVKEQQNSSSVATEQLASPAQTKEKSASPVLTECPVPPKESPVTGSPIAKPPSLDPTPLVSKDPVVGPVPAQDPLADPVVSSPQKPAVCPLPAKEPSLDLSTTLASKCPLPQKELPVSPPPSKETPICPLPPKESAVSGFVKKSKEPVEVPKAQVTEPTPPTTPSTVQPKTAQPAGDLTSQAPKDVAAAGPTPPPRKGSGGTKKTATKKK